MPNKSFSRWLVTTCFIAMPVLVNASDKGLEPQQDVVLTVDGKKHVLVAGDTQTLDIGGKQRKVRLDISLFKKFNKAGMKFHYLGQRHFSYEKLSEQVDHWSLDGNNTIIMVQHYHAPVTRKDIIQEFQNQFKAMKAKLGKRSATLEHKNGKLEGDRLHITLGNVRLTQDIFVIPGRGSARTFILQDTLTDKGANTKEYFETRKRIEKSLSL